ncbi:beta-glucan-transporting ATPase [Fusarium circinatum]|uniref:Beta-glucan-transporting ATPase n=1 Tax=Fusarium circinatum TaxID=48490 RepID=A0A8H5UFC3_FUSCI|nr:beta-glucan-transporting ATPase [Fusarium circinatum]
MRSTRPADLAVLFSLLSLGFDVAVVIQKAPEECLIPATQIALKLLLVATESQSKRRILKSPYSTQAPEELAGLLSRIFFWRINPILALGNRQILSGDDLPPIDHLLRSEKLRRDGLKAWDQRARPLNKIALPICLAKSMLPQFMTPVILRLCLIFFRYAQPALISSAIHTLSSHSDGTVFEAVYHHRLNRLSIMVKGTLVGLINNTALRQPSTSYNDGIALTLISTDTESVMRFATNALGIFSPILTFVIFVMYADIHGSTLDAETAFTTTALLGLVTHPANMIMTIVPRAIGSLAAFGRIQDYLVRPGRADGRRLFKPQTKDDESSPAIYLEGVNVQFQSSSRPVLENINLSINKGSITICAGAVGSGKTVLAQCILGEIPTSKGTISVSTKRIACCEQSPWLPSGTLKEAICGCGKFEPDWYRHVVELCCLDQDISALPLGDNTVIGSRGLKLSGGQRQRLSLARAVYARCEIVLLDDSFSALDHNTERKVVSNLLGTQGHFRKIGATVILIANSTKHFDLADSIVILENGRVTYEGPSNKMREEAAHLRETHVKLAVAEANTNLVETNKTIQSQTLEVTEAIVDLGRSTGDFSLYGYYLRALHPRNFFILIGCTASYSFFVTFPQYWLQKWTESPGSQTTCYIGGYIILSLLAWAATNGSMWSTHMLIAPRSGAELHRRLLTTIFRFLESVEGVVSIRSFGWVKQAETNNMQCLDKSQQPAYILLCLQLWLNIVLDLVIAAMAVILITLAVFSEGSTTVGQIGMSLNIVLVANSTLLALVTSWANLEISLGAISRLKTLEGEIVAEEQLAPGAIIPESWPSRGAVQIRDLTVSYEEKHVPALKNINISIEPGQHLVICGRTGSGKSTLLLALLRLLNTQSGSIEVDGIALSLVSLSTIREQCFISVTQDPFLLAQASLRFNLDAKLVDILDDPLSSLPHMSTGQTQLFALTRAILRVEHSSITRTKPILLLDEATSSVDGVTESIMRGIIKEVFTDNGHTVVEITHRLSGYEDIPRAAGKSRRVKVFLLSRGEIRCQGRIEDMLDFGKTA